MDNGLAAFARACRHAAGLSHTGTRAQQKIGGAALRDKAREKAAEHSTSIPPTIRYRSAEGKATVTAGRNVPLAALYEFGNVGGRPGEFRHPTFGDKENWQVQKGYPFMQPAVDEVAPTVLKAVEALADKMVEVLAHGD